MVHGGQNSPHGNMYPSVQLQSTAFNEGIQCTNTSNFPKLTFLYSHFDSEQINNHSCSSNSYLSRCKEMVKDLQYLYTSRGTCGYVPSFSKPSPHFPTPHTLLLHPNLMVAPTNTLFSSHAPPPPVVI